MVGVCDAGDYAWSRAGIRDSAALVREPAQAFEAFHAFVKHGMPITNTWPSVSWRRGFGSNSSKSAPLRASAAANARLSASRKSSPQVTMNSGGRLTLNARPSAVRNFGSAASMRRRIRRPASVRVRCGDSDRSYGQFASHGFQRCGTVGTAHRSGTGETNARRLIHAECGSGFGIVFNRQRQHGQRAACRIAGEEHGVRINRIISQMRLDPTQCRLNVRQLTPQIGLRGRSVVQ